VFWDLNSIIHGPFSCRRADAERIGLSGHVQFRALGYEIMAAKTAQNEIPFCQFSCHSRGDFFNNQAMATDESGGHTEDRPEPLFVTTHWSVVLAAGCGDSTRAYDALAHLCKTYWYPLYAYARRRGCSPHDAQDMTQEFFARLLAGNWVAKADQQRGRFRSFLLSAMKHFMANEWNKTQTQKRGGGQSILPLDDDSAENRYQLEREEKAAPESRFEQEWAVTLLERALSRLEEEYRRAKKQAWMEAMRPALTTDRGALDYPDLAHKLGVTETAARMAVHRLRQRYRQLIRAEVASTVASPEEVEAEMRHLFQVLTTG
jgi:RNA polymerase sigma-70 factor (ECF subfamily)